MIELIGIKVMTTLPQNNLQIIVYIYKGEQFLQSYEFL